MKMFNISTNVIKSLNALTCLFICIVLLLAQLVEYYNHELPCPLCLLQRVGFTGIAFGFLLNAYDKPRQGYYFAALVSALLTITAGLRQVLFHIVPDTGVYGSPFLGLHLYTWSVVLAGMIIVWITLLLMSNKQFNDTPASKPLLCYRGLFFLLALLTLANTVTTFGICGLGTCPGDPAHYLWQAINH